MTSARFYLFAQSYYGFCWTLTTTLSLVFMVQVAGLDPLQMVLVGTVLELSAFAFEIPTGVVADTVSRRLSVIVGFALFGLGFLIVPLFPSFEMILLAQVVWALGATFVSGAFTAWLTSEVGTEAASPLFLRAGQLKHIAGFLGIVLAVVLGHVSLALPIIVGSVGLIVLAGLMVVLMKERNFRPAAPQDIGTWSGMADSFGAGVRVIRGQHLLALMLVVAIVFGAFSEGIDRLFVPLIDGAFQFPELGRLSDITWWGIIAGISTLLGLAAISLARRWVDIGDRRHITRALSAIVLAIAGLVMLVGTMSDIMWVLVCYWLLMGLRSASGPLTLAWLNPLLPEANRATLLSMYSQADAVGQTVGGPMLGVIAKYVTIGAALVVSGLLLIPNWFIYRRLSGILDRDASKTAA